jgi:hypothetical protein
MKTDQVTINGQNIAVYSMNPENTYMQLIDMTIKAKGRLSPDQFQYIQDQVRALAAPYGLNYDKAESLLASVTLWLKNPDNDHFRARGDTRWQMMSDAQNTLLSLFNPF